MLFPKILKEAEFTPFKFFKKCFYLSYNNAFEYLSTLEKRLCQNPVYGWTALDLFASLLFSARIYSILMPHTVYNMGMMEQMPWKRYRARERPTWVWGRRCWAQHGISWWFLRLWTSCASSPAGPWGTHYWGASTAVRWTCSGSCHVRNSQAGGNVSKPGRGWITL